MKRIKGVYEGEMNYKRFDGITAQEFYDANEKEVEDHIGKTKDGKEWQWKFNNMYSDIMEGD